MTLCPIRLDIDPVPTSPLPVDLTLVKSHCAVDFDDQDDLLMTYIMAAVNAFENTTHRTLFLREHRWVLKGFPLLYRHALYQRIWLPRGKTRSVEQIDYWQGGIQFTLTGPTSTPAGDNYQEDLRGDDGGMIMPPRGQSWPSTDCDAPAPVTITFTAGWTTAELPSDILTALLFFVRTSLDDARTDPQKTEADLRSFEAMVSGYRISRFY
jgi:uncharacterized phiE125 gp8 family phage protein